MEETNLTSGKIIIALIALFLFAVPCWARPPAIPVLMYHHIREIDSSMGYWEKELSCRPAVFRSHLDYMKSKHYTPITFKELEECEKKGYCPVKPIILTFDDSSKSQWISFTILMEYGWKGVYFPYIDGLGKDRFLGRERVLSMSEAGMEIGSHTMSHPWLAKMKNEKRLEWELTESKKYLEKLTGKEVISFAYPFGNYNVKVMTAVKKAGYRYARTCNEWIWERDGNYEIPMVYIHYKTTTLRLP